MSKKVNPLYVGSFVVSAAIVFVLILVVFSSSTLFVPTVRFYVFFDTSLNGLDVGAAVKFKGVRIGSVEAINIMYDGDVDKAYLSVLLKIDATSLRTMKNHRASNMDYREFYAEQISHGLAAKLSLDSFVTGKSFVALDYYPNDNERYFKDTDGLKYQQMPSMMTDFDEFISNVNSIVKNFMQIDFGEIGSNFNAFLADLRSTLNDLDLEHMSTAFSRSCENFSKLLSSDKIENILQKVGMVVDKLNLRFDGIIDEIFETFSNVRKMFDDNSPFMEYLKADLLQFERMLRALREFLEFLERNPNAILAGKHL
ncbi:MAG: MlaD family protein [Puniceicoccales bacterium]|nr:MlaD family protein [Puniceicoccales bacterium]